MIGERTTVQLKEGSSARLSNSTQACRAYYVTAGQRMLGRPIQAPKTCGVAYTHTEAVHFPIQHVDVLLVKLGDLTQVV
jgi:hypothetical protein